MKGGGAEFCILGPVEVRVAGGRQLGLGPVKRRLVLAALLVDVGYPVSLPTLADRVWDTCPPPQASKVLYAHLARIRQTLSAAGEDGALHRRSGGYALDIDPDQVDAYNFRRLVELAGDDGCALDERGDLLRRALALWRGPALADLPGEWVARVRAGWAQQRLSATVSWADALLRVGEPGAVLGPLSELAAEHPLVEPVVATLVRALHTAGRTADALTCYATARQRLVDELGVNPGPELQRAHQVVLRGTPALATEVTPSTASEAGLPTPVQLPRDVARFVGRRPQLDELDQLLAGHETDVPAVIISAVSGAAGVGKTALALHWAWRARGNFPDGQLYVNLRGFDATAPALTAAEAIRGFLDALGMPARRIPSDLDAQIGLYRSLLAGRRMLILLDNARDPGQVRPLLPGCPGSVVLVTSRSRLTGLIAADGAHPLTVDLLDADEARQLLAARLGTTRLAAEPAAADRIIQFCGRLPLALAIVAAHLAVRPTLRLADTAEELTRSRSTLDAFSDADQTVNLRSVFACSYRQLPTAAARMFRLVGLHPGPDISLPAAASLAGVTVQQASRLLSELGAANLLDEATPGRYRQHDLVAAYAGETARSEESQADRTAAIHRLLDHYLHSGHTAALLISPHRDPIALDRARPGTVTAGTGDTGAPLDWFNTEHHCLLASVELAVQHRFDRHAIQLAWALSDYLDRQGRWHDWASTQHNALAAAQRSGDRAEQARAHRYLARASIQLDRPTDTDTHLRHALALSRDLADQVGEAHTHMNLSVALERQGRHREALQHAEKAADLFCAAGHQDAHTRALNAVGWCHAMLGNNQQALTVCNRALQALKRSGDLDGTGHTLDSLGYIHNQLGDYQRAVACYHEAIDIFRETGDRRAEADTLLSLRDTHRASGDTDAADDTSRRAEAILAELDPP